MSTDDITIRRATDDECPLVSEIVAASVRALWRGHCSDAGIEAVARQNSAERIRERAARQEDYLAWRGETALGYVGLKRNEIGTLFVHPDAVGQGIGAALVAFSTGVIRGRGHKTSVVYAFPTAVGFYERHGFRSTGKEVSFEIEPGAFVPAVLMEADLWPPAEGAGARQPLLGTNRLSLRPFTLDDAATVQRLAGDEAVAATTLNVPHPYEDGMAEAWIRTHGRRFDRGEAVTFAVTLRDDGTLIGAIGLTIDDRHGRAELGYWIGKPYWGRGYATEAGRAVVRYGFEVLGLNRIQASHFEGNLASGRVMQKLGMAYEGRRRQAVKKGDRFIDLDGYAILKSEYEQPEDGARADVG